MVFWRQTLKWTAVVLLAVGLVVAGTLIGWRVGQDHLYETAVGQVSVEAEPSFHGEIEAFIPVAGWGIRADAFDAPLKLRAELRSINRQDLLRASDGDSDVLAQTQDDLRRAAWLAVIRAAAWGAGAALILLLVASLVWRGLRPRWSLMATGVSAMLLLYGGSALRAQSTFDTTAFESPTYFAQGDEIGRILDLATEARVQSEYGDDFTTIVQSISSALAVGRAPETGGTEFYAGSDLHANALVIDPVAELVGDSPLLLAGDFGQRGGEAESRLLAPKVAALGSEVVAVSGNHDSDGLMRKLVTAGVTVLGQKGRLREDGGWRPPPVVDLSGISLAGFSDPLQYGGSGPSGTDRPVTAEGLDDPEAAIEGWRRDLLDWFTSLPVPPAVLMVHQDGLAQWLAQSLHDIGYLQPLTIVTGHDHEQHVDRYGEIFVVDGGTLGAGGIFGAGEESVGISRLRFNERKRLESIDLISVEPVSGAARATRIVVDTMCPVERRCRIEPDQGSMEIDGE
ncbi:MAG TPA: metallophosphoesterase family protein [Solirubrobacterales bacterium]|nr:metallophosphoesterase family protein [Solirubrobacterales bacterium]